MSPNANAPYLLNILAITDANKNLAVGGTADPSSGGVFGPFNIPAYGLVFLGWGEGNGDIGSGNPVRVNTQPFQQIDASLSPVVAWDGIPMRPGSYFRLPRINSQWYFALPDT